MKSVRIGRFSAPYFPAFELNTERQSEGINCPSEKDEWKESEKNNLTIALNVLYAKNEIIYPAKISKHNSNREKQVIILMIINAERWYYIAVKKLSALLRGILSKLVGDFYCFICLHSFITKNKLEAQKKVYKRRIFVLW